MPRHQLEDLRKITRARRAWDLWISGQHSQDDIARMMSVHRSTISRWLARHEEKFLAECRESIERVKARQTARLERITHEAMRAWDKSKAPAYRAKRKQTPKGPEFEETYTGQVGDPRFLDQARSAQAEIRRIWGIEKPETGDGGRTLAEMADEMDAAASSYQPERPPGEPPK